MKLLLLLPLATLALAGCGDRVPGPASPVTEAPAPVDRGVDAAVAIGGLQGLSYANSAFLAAQSVAQYAVERGTLSPSQLNTIRTANEQGGAALDRAGELARAGSDVREQIRAVFGFADRLREAALGGIER